MPLAPGTRLGPYEVTAQIGVGGMGEVYRATDTNLKRQVAIKVLPESVAGDADRLARFRREAEVLAALNHPNIAQIHGLEQSDGQVALVMELVEGPTLADLIANGHAKSENASSSPSDSASAALRGAVRGLSLDDALSIARQVAEALEAAHEHSIIHRDSKPANIKVRDDGTVKVLDFGLAKALDPAGESGSASASMSPTMTSPAMTQAGFILGTAPYMSPEQARGRRVDKRTDIWAFGCVLYEMLTGRRAFSGEDVTETIAAVIKGQPDLSILPASVRPVVEKCLEKDPRQRLRDIGDVRLVLEGAFRTPEPEAAAVVAPTLSVWRRALPVAMTAIAVSLVTGLTAWTFWPSAVLPVVTRFDADVPAERPFRSRGRTVLALSRDGWTFVYNAVGGLFLRTMDNLEARPILGTEESLANPFFSFDGQFVGFFQDNYLKRVPVGGGAAADVCPAKTLFGASWEADGTILFGQPEGILRVPAGGGAPKIAIPVGAGERVYGPHLLPDGDSVLFSTTTTSWDEAQIVAQSLRTGARTVLVPRGHDARYVPTGHLIYAQADVLFAVAFDAERLVVSGAHVSVVQGMDRDVGGSTGAAYYAVSDTGTLVYVAGGGPAQVQTTQLTWFNRKGDVVGTLGKPEGNMRSPDLSPDGEKVAVSIDTRDGRSSNIWIVDSIRPTQVTFGSEAEGFPLWSKPDGSRVHYMKSTTMSAAGVVGQFAVPSAGGGREETITNDRRMINMTSSSADGRFVLVDKGPVDIWVIPQDGDRKPFPFIDGTAFAERDAQFSPDDQFVAYQSNETGRAEIYIRPFVPPGSEPRVWQTPVSIDGGAQPRWNPRWSPEGWELYWIAPDAKLMAAKIVVRDDRVVAGTPFPLFSTRIAMGGAEMSLSGQYNVARDGRFLINAVVGDGKDQPRPQVRITVVQSWTEELKRLVPTGPTNR